MSGETQRVVIGPWSDTDPAQIDDCPQACLPRMDRESGLLISLNMQARKLGG